MLATNCLGFCCMVVYMCLSLKILVRYMYINSPKTKCIKTSRLFSVLYLSDYIWQNLFCILQRQPLYDSDTSYMYVYFTNNVIIVSIVEEWQEALTDWLTCTYMIIHHFVKSTFKWREYFSSVSKIRSYNTHFCSLQNVWNLLLYRISQERLP